MKLFAWIKGLFTHPKTTVAGVGALAGAAALGYGMYSGAVPINAETIATTGGLASAGVAGVLGSDSGGPQAAHVIDSLTGQAVQVTPAAMGVMQQVQQMKQDAANGQAKVNEFQIVAGALAQMAQNTTTPKPE